MRQTINVLADLAQATLHVRARAVVATQRLGGPDSLARTRAKMLEFSARHGTAQQVEPVPMSRVNEAPDHLRAGRAHYPVGLDADFA